MTTMHANSGSGLRRRVLVLMLALVCVVAVGWTQAPPASGDGPATQGTGLIRNDAGAYQGYTLLSPLSSQSTYLIDMAGRVVNEWNAGSTPSSIAYLLENGHLLRAGAQPNSPYGGGVAGGGGKVQEFTWEGELAWDFTYSTASRIPHHDFIRLPNGNVLLIVQDRKTADEAIAAGRIPSSVQGAEVHVDSLVEIKPTGKTTGEVVWEWQAWDHLVQDHDKAKANYGDVAAHPERIDFNFNVVADRRANPDWTHFNAVAYNAKLDQLVVSLRNFSEIWIIDHSTTTKEATGRSGGRSGKGGDLLYRWGNPRAYRAGTAADQRLFGQHNAHWIPDGMRGAGHLLLFNNGDTRPDARYSSADEIVLPVDANGRYALTAGSKYGPEQPVWSYTAPNKTDFYSVNISGLMRLPNGNTLICAGAPGITFEVDPSGRVVWQYNLPAFAAARGRGAGPAGVAPAGPGLAPPQAAPGVTAPPQAAPSGTAPPQAAPGGTAPPQAGPAAGAPPGAGVPPGAGAPGRAAGPGRGGLGGNAGRNVFRAYRYGLDYPAFAGRKLVAGQPLDQLVP